MYASQTTVDLLHTIRTAGLRLEGWGNREPWSGMYAEATTSLLQPVHWNQSPCSTGENLGGFVKSEGVHIEGILRGPLATVIVRFRTAYMAGGGGGRSKRGDAYCA